MFNTWNQLSQAQRRVLDHAYYFYIPGNTDKSVFGDRRVNHVLIRKGLVDGIGEGFGQKIIITLKGMRVYEIGTNREEEYLKSKQYPPTEAQDSTEPDAPLYSNGDFYVSYYPEHKKYIVESGGGDPLDGYATLEEAKAAADRHVAPVDSAPRGGTAAADVPYADEIAALRADLDTYPTAYVREVQTRTLRSLLDAIEILGKDNATLQAQLTVYTGQVAQLTDDLAAAQAALKPFADQWQGWKSFSEDGGELDIVEFFSDHLETAVLAKWLKGAYDALKVTQDTAS